MDPASLHRVPLLAALPAADLARLAAHCEERLVPAGSLLLEEGSPGDALYVILEGAFEVLGGTQATADCALMYAAGGYINELALLSSTTAPASLRAVQDSRLLQIRQRHFQQMLRESPAALSAVLDHTAGRLQQTQALAIQQERMAQLGAMSAGLVHDLNNPAAAIKRGSAQIGAQLAELEQSARQVGALGLTPEQQQALSLAWEQLARRRGAVPAGDLLARDRLERELEAWLEARAVPSPWEPAAVLAELGWSTPELERLLSPFPAAAQPAIAAWLCRGANVASLLGEISTSAEQLSQLVRAIKAYSHQEPHAAQQVDVQEGLEYALVIMRHKLGSGIRVVREYAGELPRITAYASELNQVWINLIDNAIEAMQERGTLTLRSRQTDGAVEVEIIDDGPGIPPAVQERLFDPFFTTKPPGRGTGLGLHIAHQIIVQKHRGQIEVRSAPGTTCFSVRLPIGGPDAQAGADA